jgi:hypothetical protein
MIMEVITFCCDNFSWMIQEAGKKGFSIVSANLNGTLGFMLQARNQSGFIVEQGIKFCPWCGKHLDDVIKRNKAVFMELAKRHEDLIL